MNKKVEYDYINFYIVDNKIKYVFCNRTLGANQIGVSPTMINMYKSGNVNKIRKGDIVTVDLLDIDKVISYLLKFKNNENVI